MLLGVCSKVKVLLLFYIELINQFCLLLLDLLFLCLHDANKLQKKHTFSCFFTPQSVLFHSFVAAAERRKVFIDCPKVN